MAYTTDKTWTAGTVVLASDLQTYVSNNLKWLSTDKPMARAYTSVAVSHTVPSNYQSLTFNFNSYDNASVHSTTSNTERFTVPSGGGGKWLFGGSISWAANGTGVRYVSVVINGSVVPAENFAPGDGSLFTSQSVSTFYSVSATNYFALAGWQSSGGSLDMNVNSNAWAFWVGI